MTQEETNTFVKKAIGDALIRQNVANLATLGDRIGISRPSIYRYYNGESSITAENLFRIMEAAGMDVKSILRSEDKK